MAFNAKRQGHDNPIHTPAAAFVTDTFRLVAETRKQANHIAESARDAVKSFYRDPQQLAAFIERHHTPVYVIERGLPVLILSLLGFEPGFIAPSDQKRYHWLQTLLNGQGAIHLGQARPGCHFEHGVFVLTRPLYTVGFLSHQLHHWLAFRSGMHGYSKRAQELYKRFWSKNNGLIGDEIYDMSAEDILALKEAINRDMEALNFLKDIASEVLIPAKQAQRLSHGTASA